MSLHFFTFDLPSVSLMQRDLWDTTLDLGDGSSTEPAEPTAHGEAGSPKAKRQSGEPAHARGLRREQDLCVYASSDQANFFDFLDKNPNF